MKSILISLLIVLFYSGCTKKVSIYATQPAKVDKISKYKKIAVLNFENDTMGLSQKVESKVYEAKFDNKSFFTVVNVSNRKDIINEQKFQYSGLVNKDNIIEVGNLIGAQSLITGKINNTSFTKNYYREKRRRCNDKKCKSVSEYSVSCTKGTYLLSATISVTNVEFGDIIYTNNFNESAAAYHCSDYSGGLPSKKEAMNSLAIDIVNGFIPNIAPTKVKFYVELLDDPEVDYTDEQEDLLEYAAEYLHDKRIDKSEQLLSKLLKSTNDSCYVAAYNLGVIKEIKGEYKKAQQLYQLADNLVLEPNELINKAVLRIEKTISDFETLNEQSKI